MPSRTKTNSKPPQIQFHFPYGALNLKERTKLKTFIASLFRREKQPFASMDYIFCTDEHLLEINRSFLKHNFYTDIITFNLSGDGQPVAGEIYISVDRVRDNAMTFDESFQRELHRVIFHGALHLCGYKDKSSRDAQLMRKMEDKYLDLYF